MREVSDGMSYKSWVVGTLVMLIGGIEVTTERVPE